MGATNHSSLSVFLSHSHKDIDKVRKIRDILETINIDPIMFYLRCLDDNNGELESFIKKEIEARNIFIYCKSDNAEKSVWVQKELEYIRQIDSNRLYVLDIENNFEHSLVETLQTLSQLIRRNHVILCHSSHKEDVDFANTIDAVLRMKGYSTEHIHLYTTVPSMKNLEIEGFQKYKLGLEVYLEKEIEPIIMKFANKGIFAFLLTPHLFDCDEQWARMIYWKITTMCEDNKCLYVPIQLQATLTDEGLIDIMKSIYKKSIEQ